MDDFKQIPNFSGRYEINSAGVIRNIETGHIMKPHDGTFRAYIKGKYFSASVAKLLSEVHGLPLPPPSPYWKKKPVTIIRGNEIRHFDSVGACFEYLSATFFYSYDTVREYFRVRKEFCGWRLIK